MLIPLRHEVLPVAGDSVLGDGVISRGRTLETAATTDVHKNVSISVLSQESLSGLP
jgi:hypothetical protein